MNQSVDNEPYIYRLEPPTGEGPYQTEAELLTVLRKLKKHEPLYRYQVHVYEGMIDEAHHIGTEEAVIVWILKGVDMDRFDQPATQEEDG